MRTSIASVYEQRFFDTATNAAELANANMRNYVTRFRTFDYLTGFCMNLLIRIKKFLNDHDPIWLTLGYVLFSLAVAALLIYFPDLKEVAPFVYNLLSYALLIFPVVLTVFYVWNYKKCVASMTRLASLYLQIILMFSVIHFYAAAAHASKTQRSEQTGVITGPPDCISGIDTDWISLVSEDTVDHGRVFHEAIECYVDCLHFSLITSTTVGYGDMTPQTMAAKIVVDIQVLVSLFLVAFGVGTFFSRRSNENEDQSSVPNCRLDGMEANLLEKLSQQEAKLTALEKQVEKLKKKRD